MSEKMKKKEAEVLMLKFEKIFKEKADKSTKSVPIRYDGYTFHQMQYPYGRSKIIKVCIRLHPINKGQHKWDWNLLSEIDDIEKKCEQIIRRCFIINLQERKMDCKSDIYKRDITELDWSIF